MPPVGQRDHFYAQNANQCALTWRVLRLTHDRVARLLTRELARQCDLSISDFDVLLYLGTQGDAESRMRDLSEAVLLSQPALSRLIARLVERGLLARSTAGDDGRAVLVHLTEHGRFRTAQAIQVHLETIQRTVLGRLTDVERNALTNALARIAE